MKQFDGSFRGVPFKVSGEYAETVEKQYARHEYPYQTKSKIESLGKKSNAYKVVCFVSGATVDSQSNALCQSLDDDSIGKLSHPFFGDKRVKCLRYTRTASTSYKGRINFDIDFEECDEISYPTSSGITSVGIFSSIDKFKSRISSIISSAFVSTYPSSQSSAFAKLKSLSDSAMKAASIPGATADEINNARYVIDTFSNNISSFVRNPSGLGESVVGLFDSLKSFGSGIDAKKIKWSGFFSFGDKDETKAPITTARLEIADNSRIINNSVQTMALIELVGDYTENGLSTESELSDARSTIESQYQKLANRIRDTDVLGDLSIIRSRFREWTDEEAISVANTIQINTPQQPLLKMVYQYYGSIENYESIKKLNSISDPAFVEGDKKVLSS